MFHYKELDRHGLFDDCCAMQEYLAGTAARTLVNETRERRQDCYVVKIKEL